MAKPFYPTGSQHTDGSGFFRLDDHSNAGQSGGVLWWAVGSPPPASSPSHHDTLSLAATPAPPEAVASLQEVLQLALREQLTPLYAPLPAA